MTAYRNLLLVALLLTFVVVNLGAYVRLSDAGLGCPDWPGCYGRLSPHHASEQIAAAHAAQPEGPVSHAKAWKEMVHRYFAGGLGLLVVAIVVTRWRGRVAPSSGIGLSVVLLALIVFQALLGMWTVTELLKPLVVTAHLLGGMATLSLLLWLWLRERPARHAAYFAPADHLRGSALLGLVLVALQIALGGWVSTNYAATACVDFPLCQGQWLPPVDFAQGFTLHRPLGETPDGEFVSLQALTAIHWGHRALALVVALYLGRLVMRLLRAPGYARLGLLVGGVLAAQLSLGIANVLLSLPLPLAVAHNAGAALLLSSLVLLNYRVHRR